MDGANEKYVLIVEDDTFTRKVITTMLKTIGFLTLEAKDGREGIGMVKARGPDIFAAITDHNMPEATGAAFTIVVKHLQPEVAIIMVTGSNIDGLEEEVEAAGCHFLSKPINFDRLKDILSIAAKNADRGIRKRG